MARAEPPKLETALARDKPAISGSQENWVGATPAGRSKTEAIMELPAGALQLRPERPRPDTCSPAVRTAKSGNPGAFTIKSVLVEPALSTASNQLAWAAAKGNSMATG